MMAVDDKLGFQPDYAIAPGESLKELIDSLGKGFLDYNLGILVEAVLFGHRKKVAIG